MPKNLFEDLDSDIIEVEEEEDATDDDIHCLNLAIPPRFADAWKLNHETSPFTKKGNPRKDFFNFFLERANIVEIGKVEKNKLPKNLQEMIDIDLENKYHETETTDKLIETSKILSNTVNLLRWLYNYMGEHTDLKEGFMPSKKDMEIIDGIEEIIKEGSD